MSCYMYISASGKIRSDLYCRSSNGRSSPGRSGSTRPPGEHGVWSRLPIYVCGRKKEISSYRRNLITGDLSLSALYRRIPARFDITDRKGRFLLSSYWADGKVSVHKIGADGIVLLRLYNGLIPLKVCILSIRPFQPVCLCSLHHQFR